MCMYVFIAVFANIQSLPLSECQHRFSCVPLFVIVGHMLSFGLGTQVKLLPLALPGKVRTYAYAYICICTRSVTTLSIAFIHGLVTIHTTVCITISSPLSPLSPLFPLSPLSPAWSTPHCMHLSTLLVPVLSLSLSLPSNVGPDSVYYLLSPFPITDISGIHACCSSIGRCLDRGGLHTHA